MSRSYWLPVIAAIGLALAGTVDARPIGEHQGHRKGTTDAQTIPSTGAVPGPSIAFQNGVERIARALEAANNEQPSAKEKQDAQDNLNAQQNMATWAFWMFVVGAVEAILTGAGVLLVWRTLKASWAAAREAKRAADAANTSIEVTREIGQKQVRAYLHCLESNYVLSGPDITLWPIVKNTGQSPATRISISAQAYVWVKGNDDNLSLKISEPRTCGVAPVAGGEAANGVIGFDNPIKFSPGVDLKTALNPEFSVRGILKWEDVFGSPQEIGFTFVKSTDAEMARDGIYTKGVMGVIHNIPLTEAELHEDDWLLDEAEKASD